MFKNTFQSGFLSILYSLGYGTKKVRAFLFPVTSSGNILVFECFRVRDCDKEHAHV
ncbi:hypothetical protein JHK84_037113 [Glycine max]|nr:hypothetical protein JHK84_037113 [Glycine max]